MKYIPGLNGIRAIAVFFVILYHWELPPQLMFLKKILPNGNFGVNLFFVLSGFLISAILLIEKEKAIGLHQHNRKIITSFYIRRFLRIFPVYYLTLLLLLFANLPGFRSNMIYYLTYTENFHVYFAQSWDSFSHTWSLSVEEQFYLIWPCIIVFTRKSKLAYVFCYFILLGPMFSIFQTVFLKPSLNVFILTPSCFDAFGIGALLAYCYTNNNLALIKKCTKILLPFSILLFWYWIFAQHGGHFQYFKRMSDSIIASGLILFCLSNKYTSLRNKLLENRAMYQLGTVSYGIYLFHYSIPYFFASFKNRFNISFGKFDDLIGYGLMYLILVIISFASCYLFEKPILSFKKRFTY